MCPSHFCSMYHVDTAERSDWQHSVLQGSTQCRRAAPSAAALSLTIYLVARSCVMKKPILDWSLPRIAVSGSTPTPWSETMVSIPLWTQKTLEIKGFLGLEHPFLDLVSQTPRPRGRGRPLFAESKHSLWLRLVFFVWGGGPWDWAAICDTKVAILGEKQKGTAGRGRGKKRHDNMRQSSRQFMTFYDKLQHFMTISVSLFFRHKTS